MAIQTKRTGSTEYGRWMKVLLCGEPGSGKTLLSSTFPNPYYANAEGGLMSVADRRIPYAEIRTIEDLFELKGHLELPADVREASLGVPVDTIVIDTIDEIQRILIRERLAAEKISSLRISDFGWLGEQMQAILRSFRNLDMNVVFTCHVRDTKDDESGRMIYKPALQGAISGDIPGYVDLSLFLTSKTQTVIQDNEAKQVPYRYLQTYPDSQHPWIKDRSGKLPETIEVDFTTDYSRIHQTIFGNIQSVPETEVVQSSLSKPVPAPVLEVPVAPEKQEKQEKQERAPIMAEGDFECEDCGEHFTDGDQQTLSKIKVRKVLCHKCYKVATAKR